MNRHLRKGFFFNAIGTYTNFLVQFLVQIILSRLLTPKEYGVVAIMSVFIIFFQVMIEAGLGPAIIQDKSLTNQSNRILYNFSAIFSLIFAIIFGFFGIVLSKIYGNPIYLSLTWIQAISVFFSGLNVVPTALLNKRKQFKAVNFSLVISNITASIVGVGFAFLGYGVYALIFSSITTAVVNFIFNHFFSGVSFILTFNFNPLKNVWKFSLNQYAFNFLNYFSRNSDNILIGKFMGASDLALYNKSYMLLMLPNALLINIITPVLQPVLSDYQDDITHIRKVYYEIVHILLLISIPLSVFLSTSSSQVILCLFGEQWKGAITPFLFLSTTVWCQVLIAPVGAIFQARNQSGRLLVTGFYSAIGLVFSIVLGVYLGTIDMLSICLTLGFIYSFLIHYYQLIKFALDGKFKLIIKEFYSPLMLAIIVYLSLKVEELVDPANIFFSLVIRASIFLVVSISFVCKSKDVTFILEFFKRN